MKRTLFGFGTLLVVFLVVFAVLAVHPARKVKGAPAPCSTSTLSGNYAWLETGFEPQEARPFHFPPVPPSSWVESSIVTFDGSGGFSASNIYDIENGVPDSGNPSSVSGGTYSIDSTSCALTINYTWEDINYTDHGVALASGSGFTAVEQDNKKETTGKVEGRLIANPT